MISCASPHDRPSLLERTRLSDYASSACAALQRLRAAADAAQCGELLAEAAACLGADAAFFTTFLRQDATQASYRSLLACDPGWGTEYAAQGWFEDDPWLLHAMHSAEPVRASALAMGTPRRQAFAEAAARYGFRSAVIVPAPSPKGQARVGVLVLGSHTAGYFEAEGYGVLEILAWPLAMELQVWWHEHIRRELVERARITDDDLVLLRYEDRGHTSKQIAIELKTLAKTIDCRFQRVSSKLAAPNRKAAVRLAKLYGLI